MPGRIKCPFCGKENNRDQLNCAYCGADLLQGDLEETGSSSRGAKQFVTDEENAMKQEQDEWQDEFAELDYRPKKKPLFLIFLITIVIAGLILAGGFYFLRSEEAEPVTEPVENDAELEFPEEETAEEPDELIPEEPGEEKPDEEAGPEEEEIGEEEEEEKPPDYEQLEPALVEWLEKRLGDPDVIMLHPDDLEDTEEFFEKYDLAEDNVIVHRVESKDEEFATVKFGAPFSEWSVKAVFIWEDSEWGLLREESLE
ncbi:MAG: hypothetical protein R6U91_03905 [Bacillota bacterium]